MDIYITVAPIVVIKREIQADYTKLDNTQTGCDVDCYSFSFKIKYDVHDLFRSVTGSLLVVDLMDGREGLWIFKYKYKDWNLYAYKKNESKSTSLGGGTNRATSAPVQWGARASHVCALETPPPPSLCFYCSLDTNRQTKILIPFKRYFLKAFLCRASAL